MKKNIVKVKSKEKPRIEAEEINPEEHTKECAAQWDLFLELKDLIKQRYPNLRENDEEKNIVMNALTNLAAYNIYVLFDDCYQCRADFFKKMIVSHIDHQLGDEEAEEGLKTLAE